MDQNRIFTRISFDSIGVSIPCDKFVAYDNVITVTKINTVKIQSFRYREDLDNKCVSLKQVRDPNRLRSFLRVCVRTEERVTHRTDTLSLLHFSKRDRKSEG